MGTSAPTEAIENLRSAFMDAENRGDPSVQLRHRAETDFVRMPPGRPPMDAAEAAKSLERLYASTDLTVEWESDGILADEDLAVDSGSFTITWSRGDGESCNRTGSWLMVFRRTESNHWEVVRDIYNWDEPPASVP